MRCLRQNIELRRENKFLDGMPDFVGTSCIVNEPMTWNIERNEDGTPPNVRAHTTVGIFHPSFVLIDQVPRSTAISLAP